jgi:hypothetical protein
MQKKELSLVVIGSMVKIKTDPKQNIVEGYFFVKSVERVSYRGDLLARLLWRPGRKPMADIRYNVEIRQTDIVQALGRVSGRQGAGHSGHVQILNMILSGTLAVDPWEE